MNIKDIEPNKGIESIEIEVTQIEEPREFNTFRGSGKLASAVAKDDTGEVKLTLWNDQIEQVKVGDKIKIENGWAKEYRGELQISTGIYGKLSIVK